MVRIIIKGGMYGHLLHSFWKLTRSVVSFRRVESALGHHPFSTPGRPLTCCDRTRRTKSSRPQLPSMGRINGASDVGSNLARTLSSLTPRRPSPGPVYRLFSSARHQSNAKPGGMSGWTRPSRKPSGQRSVFCECLMIVFSFFI